VRSFPPPYSNAYHPYNRHAVLIARLILRLRQGPRAGLRGRRRGRGRVRAHRRRRARGVHRARRGLRPGAQPGWHHVRGVLPAGFDGGNFGLLRSLERAPRRLLSRQPAGGLPSGVCRAMVAPGRGLRAIPRRVRRTVRARRGG
jgi:hypothetical protein